MDHEATSQMRDYDDFTFEKIRSVLEPQAVVTISNSLSCSETKC